MQWRKGRTRFKDFVKGTSVTFTNGHMVRIASGVLATCTNTTTMGIVGIIQKSVASTDSDYATAGVNVSVEVPLDDTCEFSATVANGTLLTTSVGGRFAFSTTGGNIDFADTTDTAVICSQYISGTQGLFTIEKNALWSSSPNLVNTGSL